MNTTTTPATAKTVCARAAPAAPTRLRWWPAGDSQRKRWARQLDRWLRQSHLYPEAEAAALPWLARRDGVAAYCAAWLASRSDRHAAATDTSEIPEPVLWSAGDEDGTWGPTTEQPGLLRCGPGTWPVPWNHDGSKILRRAWGRIDEAERAEQDYPAY